MELQNKDEDKIISLLEIIDRDDDDVIIDVYVRGVKAGILIVEKRDLVCVVSRIKGPETGIKYCNFPKIK